MVNMRNCNWLEESLLFSINQDPKSKNISISEAREFRKALSDKVQRRYTEEICVFFSFFSTKRNSPQVHKLVKNYMDLMHKPMEGVDNLSRIVFDDDSQVSYLHAIHYCINETESNDISEDPQISIWVVPFRYFKKMVHLVYDSCERPQRDDFFQDESNFAETIKLLVGKPGFEKISQITVKKAEAMDHIINQESLLNFFNLSIFDIAPIWKAYKNPQYKCFEELYHYTLELMSIKIPKIPTREGDSEKFESDLKEKLEEFKQSINTMDAIQIPVGLKFLYFPPNRRHTKDIDNIVLKSIPKIIDILHPPIRRQMELIVKEDQRGVNQYEILKMPCNKRYKEGILTFVVTNNISFKSFWKEGLELLEQKKSRLNKIC